MSEGSAPEQGELGILRTGDRLRMAREQAGLSLADVALKTRITLRHLEAIERSDFDALPGRTYITGFARAFARAVDLPEADVSKDIRTELSNSLSTPREAYEAYEPADPMRVPSRRVALTVLAVIALVAAGYATWRTFALDTSPLTDATELTGGGEQETASQTAPTAIVATKADTVPADAKVILTGIGEVWIGFDDASGKTENWRTLDPGEELVVPASYMEQFTLRTAQPQMLKITVDGKEIGPIGPASTLVKNVSLKPADLLARVPTSGAPAASLVVR